MTIVNWSPERVLYSIRKVIARVDVPLISTYAKSCTLSAGPNTSATPELFWLLLKSTTKFPKTLVAVKWLSPSTYMGTRVLHLNKSLNLHSGVGVGEGVGVSVGVGLGVKVLVGVGGTGVSVGSTVCVTVEDGKGVRVD